MSWFKKQFEKLGNEQVETKMNTTNKVTSLIANLLSFKKRDIVQVVNESLELAEEIRKTKGEEIRVLDGDNVERVIVYNTSLGRVIELS